MSMLKLYDMLLEDVAKLHKDGMPPGEPTGWQTLDKHFTVKEGQLTLITGIPSHGKSTWLDALMVNLVLRGWFFAVYSPENHPPALHLSKFIEKFTGKPFGHGLTERVTMPEVETTLRKICANFALLDLFDLQNPKVEDVLDHADRFHRSRKFGIVIDPWNYLDHSRPPTLTETEYISQALTFLIGYARQHDAHIFLVAHPMKMFTDRDGNKPIPTPYHISGSAHWFNKADNCITVWRDVQADNQITEIHIQKVRFKHIGKPGMVQLRYDHVTSKYYDMGLKPVPHYSMTGGDIAI